MILRPSEAVEGQILGMSQELERLRKEFEAWWQESFGNVTVVCPQEVAEVFGKDKSTIYRWIREGRLPAKRWGKRGYLILKPGLWFWWKWLHLQEAEEC